MNTVIPYSEKLAEGAFITPKNEIKIVYDRHESFAYNYCFGNNDLSKLSKEQLKLCKRWIETRQIGDLYSDFLIYVLGFDKIQTIMKKSITTTASLPHVKYYNYYLMDWYIDQLTPMKLNNETGIFEPIKKSEFIGYTADKNAEDEINEIKAKVLKKDRPYFFK